MKLEFDWELSLFKLMLGGVERWRDGRRVRGEAATLVGLERELVLLARAIAGRQLVVQPGAGWGHTDGHVLFLPASLDRLPTRADNRALYRLMTLHKAGQMAYGGLWQANRSPDCRLGKDLFTLFEGIRTLRLLGKEFSGFSSFLAPVLPRLPARRPPIGQKAAVLETLILRALGRPGNGHPLGNVLYDGLPAGHWPAEWLAPQIADALSQLESLPGPYRPVETLWIWGDFPDLTRSDGDTSALAVTWQDVPDSDADQAAVSELASDRRIRAKLAEVDEEKANQAILFNRFEQVETAEDYFGMTRPFDDDGDIQAFGKVLDDLKLDNVVRTSRRAKNLFRADLQVEGADHQQVQAPQAGERAIWYPEWFDRQQAYRHDWCRLFEKEAPLGAEGWADDVLAKHAWTLAQLKRRFQALRPNLGRLPRQKEGEEADVDAVVQARADLLAGRSPSEHLYVARRPRDRDLAVAFLVDCSASTDAWVLDRRVLDLEKEALLLLGEAVSEVGDRFGMFAFSSKSRKNCTFYRIKEFESPFDAGVRQRIAGLEPRDYTRMGPAIRHLAQDMLRLRAARKVLLLVSDGKPNDFDTYEGRHGTADVRRALEEAKSKGIRPFCVTIDSHARHYLPRMFGPTGYLVVDAVQQLPRRLPEAFLRLARQ